MFEDACNNCQYNMQVINMLKEELPSENTIERLSNVFKVFSDSTRLKILWVLFDKEICVYDIAEALNMSQSAISHQLRILRQEKIVRTRRDGKNTFYSLDDDHVKRIIEQVLIHISE